MTNLQLKAPNISCGHCVKAIKRELSGINGVKAVDGDPGTKKINVEFEAPATEASIREAMKEINYPAE